MSGVFPPDVPRVLQEHRARIRALEAIKPPNEVNAIPISTALMVFANAQSGGVPAFTTVDTYMLGVPQEIPLFSTTVTAGFDGSMTDLLDNLTVRCPPGIYLAQATMWFDDANDPTAGLFDLLIKVSGGTAIGFTGGGVFGDFNGMSPSGTVIRPWGLSTGGVGPPFYQVAHSQLLFAVGSGHADIRATYATNIPGLTFPKNGSSPTNPGASNLSIVRIGL